MEELAYSFHLGSDKNKKATSRQQAKSNISGTTSKSNNAIQNAQQLSRVDNHNYRKYDNKQDDIVIVRGTSSLLKDVQDLYLSEFEEARIEYNSTQRETRKIDNYFNHISKDNKHDLACEIIIELGDKSYWDTKDMDFKKRMTNVYKEQIKDLEDMLPNFKVASAIIHYDETSPHIHIVGLPIKYKNKNGMSKQVGKCDVFTKDSLKVLQDKMRMLCIESFNKEYNLDTTLKAKKKGRNEDINVRDMDNYQSLKKQLEDNQSKLETANIKSQELNEETNNIKELVNDLKPTITNKDKYTLKQEDKEKLIEFIDKVDKTNHEYQNIQELSITLKDVDSKIRDDKNKIKTLTENNNGLNLRVENLNNKVKILEEENYSLKEENNTLKHWFSSLKEKFNRLLKFLSRKMFDKSEKDTYYEISKEFYTHGIIDDTEMHDLKNDYQDSFTNDKKGNKDIEL